MTAARAHDRCQTKARQARQARQTSGRFLSFPVHRLPHPSLGAEARRGPACRGAPTAAGRGPPTTAGEEHRASADVVLAAAFFAGGSTLKTNQEKKQKKKKKKIERLGSLH